MKFQSDLKHSITVENEDGVKVSFTIDSSDAVQLSAITDVFEKFGEAQNLNLDIENVKTIKELSDVIKPYANKLKEVNALLDAAFGEDITKIAFKGSSSLILYNDFFKKLSDEMEKIGIKTKDYVTKIRKDRLLNDHKQSGEI